MKIRLADYVADFLVSNGITDCFTVTGGVESAIQEIHIGAESVVYDLFGRKLSADDGRAGIVVKDGKKYYRK